MTETETHGAKFDELELAQLEGVARGGVVSGSANKNAALGFGKNKPTDSQQVFTAAQ